MAAASNNELELLRKALRLLYSPHPSSAAELRLMLDEAIQQRYGDEHTITNKMSERLLGLEANFPGRAVTPPPQQQQSEEDVPVVDEVINLTGSPAKTISDSPDTIMDSDDGISGTHGGGTMLTGGDDDVNLKEFGDLNCAVCGEMVFTATNRLIECSKCGTLYHQECHKPPITDEEASEGQEHNWQCDSCLNKPSTTKAAGIVLIDEPISLVSKAKSSATSSRSSSTSNSSSPYTANLTLDLPSTSSAAAAAASASSTTTSSKHHHKSSRSHRDERPGSSSSKSGSSGSAINPTFNVVSASDKASSHSSKRSSSHSSSSKSSSSKSSSKHHESSSKRKSK